MIKYTQILLILIMISPPRQSFDEDEKGPRLGVGITGMNDLWSHWSYCWNNIFG